VVGSIDSVRVFTRDLALARKFYVRGMGLHERATGMGWAVYDTGGAELILEQVDEDDDETDGLVGRVAGFSFTVEDCEATVKVLRERGVTIVGGPARQPWGGVLAFVEDADHNVLTLVQPS
jgi:catechol 2,3-dioxygenase-like lactoylglutathione lyase family enzyme